jgi:hypothetical protein
MPLISYFFFPMISKNLIMNKYRMMPEGILIFRLSACILTTIILIHTEHKKKIFIYHIFETPSNTIVSSSFNLFCIIHFILHHCIKYCQRRETVQWDEGESNKKEKSVREREKLSNGKLDVYIWDVMWKVHEKIARSDFHVFS